MRAGRSDRAVVINGRLAEMAGGVRQLADDNVIKFRKPPPPKPQKPPKRGPSLRLPPYVIIILAALAIGAVTYLLDQGKAANSASSRAAP